MRIAQAAELVGVATHVLRHWEDEGVLVPDRVGARREFTEQHVNEALIIHRLRLAGLGLAAIKQLRSAPQSERAALLHAEVEHLDATAARITAAATFMRHTLECQHPIVEECPECRDYASGAKPANFA